MGIGMFSMLIHLRRKFEGCSLEHPSVADVAVIGVLDDTSSEVPKASVVVASQKRNLASDSREKLMGEIAGYVRKEKEHYK
jgi:acyl-coenzyme A synthetase/AMP-(fatty) acid ligase